MIHFEKYCIQYAAYCLLEILKVNPTSVEFKVINERFQLF